MSPILLTVAWIMVLLGTLLGLRLARSAARTGEAPDWLVAAFFLSGAGVGYGSALVVPTFPDMSESARETWRLISLSGMQVPTLAIALFSWRVFRAGERWACWLSLTLVGLVLGGFVLGVFLGPALGSAALTLAPGTPLFWLVTFSRAACYVWASAESLRYYGLSRRRLSLGLADPLVTNRFLLWAIWSGSTTLILVIRSISSWITDPSDPHFQLPLAIVLGQMLAGLCCFTAVWLTFAPPVFYRRLVAGARATS